METTAIIKKPTPCLWFDNKAEEAVNFYTSIFRNSKVDSITYYGKDEQVPEGTISSVTFQLDGQQFIALNGNPQFTYSDAISFITNYNSQKEYDKLVDELSDGGQIQQFGWLTDKFGVSWQIMPSILEEMLQNEEKADRVVKAILKMKKIDIKLLKETYNS